MVAYFIVSKNKLVSKAHYFLAKPRPEYAPLVANVAGKGLALQTALELLMARDVSVTALAQAFKKISLDLNDHKDFIVQQVEDFDRYVLRLVILPFSRKTYSNLHVDYDIFSGLYLAGLLAKTYRICHA